MDPFTTKFICFVRYVFDVSSASGYIGAAYFQESGPIFFDMSQISGFKMDSWIHNGFLDSRWVPGFTIGPRFLGFHIPDSWTIKLFLLGRCRPPRTPPQNKHDFSATWKWESTAWGSRKSVFFVFYCLFVFCVCVLCFVCVFLFFCCFVFFSYFFYVILFFYLTPKPSTPISRGGNFY